MEGDRVWHIVKLMQRKHLYLSTLNLENQFKLKYKCRSKHFLPL